jgi:hypothetical protein
MSNEKLAELFERRQQLSAKLNAALDTPAEDRTDHDLLMIEYLEAQCDHAAEDYYDAIHQYNQQVAAFNRGQKLLAA